MADVTEEWYITTLNESGETRDQPLSCIADMYRRRPVRIFIRWLREEHCALHYAT